jgi:hypothetical protein
MDEFNFPKLNWLERYRRMYQAYDTAIKEAFYNELEQNGMDSALQLLIRIHQAVSSRLGEKLCQKFRFQPDVKGALELMWTYSCEVWGFGMTDTVTARLEDQGRGVFTNTLCHYWETWLKEGRELSCDKNCVNEYTSLIQALNPDYRLTMTQAFPRGNNCCEFVVELNYDTA